MHLTYLLLDVRNRLRDGAWSGASAGVETLEGRRARAELRRGRRDRFHDAVATEIEREVTTGSVGPESLEYIRLMRALLERWRAQVEPAGHFWVALLPSHPAQAPDELLFSGYDVIDLRKAQGDYGFEGKPWQFQNDGHWNELGNALAAVWLQRELSTQLGIPRLSDPQVRAELCAYDRAFARWLPSDCEEGALPGARAAELRAHYVPLDAALAAPET